MAVLEFYIQNFMRNGNLVTTETLFHEVPFLGESPITEPKVKNEIGKSGSFEFGMQPRSPYYDALLQMKTLMRVTYFGQTVFRGRVLTIDKTLMGSRTVHCEGDFSFLLDSHQIGTKEDTRPEIGVLAYLQEIITQHNADMGDDNQKKFTLGEVPGQYTNATVAEQRVVIPADKATQKFGDTSWNTSMDRLEGLLSDFGGYFRTRYNPQTGVTYLDWYDKYYNATTNDQTIEIAKNLIDISGSTEVENLFTIVIPIGKRESENVFISDYWPIVSASHDKVNYIKVSELATIPLYTDAELNSDYHHKADYQNANTRFGSIWKTVDFENADTPEKLFSYVKDWIKNNFMPELTQWDVSALDMKFVNPEHQVLLCGDRVSLRHPEVDQTYNGMTIISADLDLYNPDKNKYKIGVPNQQINSAYGVKNKSKGGGGGGGKPSENDPSDPTEYQRELDRLKKELERKYVLKTEFDKEITLDDPMSYVTYNSDLSEKSSEEAIRNVIDTASKLSRTLAAKYPELKAEALRRGVFVNDTQLLIDFTPSEKRKQDQFRGASAYHMVNDMGLTHQQANVLLYETASQSYLASLVDDEGNWTDYAYSQGAAIWRDAEELKEQAFNTKKILGGKKTDKTASSDAGEALANFADKLYAGGMNILNNFNIDQVIDEGTERLTTTIDMLDGKLTAQTEEKPKTSGSGTWFQTGFNFIGGLVSGTDSENGTDKSLSMLSGGITAQTEEKPKTSGSGTWFQTGFNFVGGLLSGNNKENGKIMSILAGDTTTGLTAQTEEKPKTSGQGTWEETKVDLIGDALTVKKKEAGKMMSGMAGNFLAEIEEKPKTSGQGTWNETTMDLMGIVTGNNTEAGGKEAEIETDTIDIDGTTGNGTIEMGVKDNQNQWPVTANKPITYTDSSGVSHTLYNAIHADDYHLDSIGSVKAELLSVATLLADYAQINTLVSLNSRIGTLEANSITVNNLAAKIADIPTLNGIAASFSGNVSCNGLLCNQVYVGGHAPYTNISNPVLYVTLTPPAEGSNQYKLTATTADGQYNDMYFSRATSLSGVWSGNAAAGKHFHVTASPSGTLPAYDSPALDMIYWTGSKAWTADYKSFDIQVNVDDEDGETLMYDTLTFDVTKAWEEGAKAVTLTGVWYGNASAGKMFKVTPSPFGSPYYSPALDMIYSSGSKTWAQDNLSFDIRVNVDDEDGENLMYDTLTFNIRDKFEATQLSTINTDAVLKLKSANVYPESTTSKIDRGSSVPAREVLASGGTLYYKTSNAVKLRYWGEYMVYTRSQNPDGSYSYSAPFGSKKKWYYIDDTSSATQYYSRSGGIRLGDEDLYYKGDGGSFPVQGQGFSAYVVDTTNGTNYYQANAATTYYKLK